MIGKMIRWGVLVFVLLSVMLVLLFVMEIIKVVVIDGYLVCVFWVKEFINFFILEVDKWLVEFGNYKMDW